MLVGHVTWLIFLYVIVWGLPNTQQIMCRFAPALGKIQAGAFTSSRVAIEP